MEVFVLRHGKAEPYNSQDASRELVERGRREVEQIIQASLNDLQHIEEIWVSPYIRAQQTAQIAAHHLRLPLRSQKLLLPETDPRLVISLIQEVQYASLLLVSHQPLVSRLVDTLCGSAAGFHSMETAALACIDMEIAGVGLGSLRWLRHPSL